MTDTTPLEAEATADTVDFDYFGRKWTVPSKTRWSHMRALKMDPTNTGIIFAYLSPEQVGALDEINPDEDEIDKFTDEIMRVLGYKTAGN